MRTLIAIMFLSVYFNSFSQKNNWSKNCENEDSEVEIFNCLKSSFNEATKYFEFKYNELFKTVSVEIKKYEPNSTEYAILSKYYKYLPLLKKTLTDNAKYSAEIEVASNIGGSGYDNIKLEILLVNIQKNIEIIEKIKTELPSFN